MSAYSEAAGGEIRVPRETVNDDIVTIASWRRDDGARVRRGECIVEIETSKAVLEVEAEADGYLQILHPRGAEVPIGELIGRLLAEPPAAAAPAPSQPAERAVPVGGSHPETAISKKAQRLIDEYGLDPASFAGRGLIRESDVIRHLERTRGRERRARRAARPRPARRAARAASAPPPPAVAVGCSETHDAAARQIGVAASSGSPGTTSGATGCWATWSGWRRVA